MEQSLNNKKQKAKSIRKSVLDSLAEKPSQIEEGLELFDRDAPSLLEDTIDLVCLDKDHRLVVIQFSEKKLTKQGSFNFFEKVFYLWQWINDFKDDFRIEVEEKTSKLPLRQPPRLIILTPDPTSIFLSLASQIKKQIVDLDMFKFDFYDETNLSFEPVVLDKSKPLDEEDIEELTLGLRRRLKAQFGVWEQIKAANPDPHGYSLKRK